MCLIHFPYEIFLNWTSVCPTFSYYFDETLNPVANSSCMPCSGVKLDIVYIVETAFLQLYQEYLWISSLWYIIITDMAYARAAGSNSGLKFQEKYYNDKMVVWMANGLTNEWEILFKIMVF